MKSGSPSILRLGYGRLAMAKVKGAKMVDSKRARIWLSKTRAHIAALSKELESATDEEAFALLYELRGKLWYEQEDFSSCGS